jgi:hypothetical protein
VVATEGSRAFDDPGRFVEIPLVNRIRPRVKAWRDAGWPGVSSITKRLLEHWNDPEEFESRRFFFCQLEAVETIIWLTEAPPSDRVGVEIPVDGGEFLRRCCKMATGSGKTIVMAMAIAWHILNKVTYPQDTRFSKNVLGEMAKAHSLPVINDEAHHDWKGSKQLLLAQLVGLVEQFIRSDKITIRPPLFYRDDLCRRLIITLNMTKVVRHIWEAVRFENTERLEPVIFDLCDEGATLWA